MKLNNKQTKFLRKLAHKLSSIIIIGQNGLNNNVIAELNSTLLHHELLKLKIKANTKDEKQIIINKILILTKAQLVQTIGSVLVIYKPFDKNPLIILPKY